MKSAETRDRPIDPDVVQRAGVLAARYRIHVGQMSGGYVGIVSDFPSVFGHGISEAAAVSTTRELLKWAIAYLIETGRAPTPRA